MFQHTTDHRHHNGLHLGEKLKKAVNWYFTHSVENYVWSAKPLDPTDECNKSK